MSNDTPPSQVELLFTEITKLQGELLATQIALRGLVLSQSDPVHAVNVMHTKLEEWMAAMLNSPLSEQQLEGYQSARRKLLPSERDQR